MCVDALKGSPNQLFEILRNLEVLMDVKLMSNDDIARNMQEVHKIGKRRFKTAYSFEESVL